MPAVSISCSCRRSIVIFPDPVAVARECRRILRADGYVCVRTGTRENDVVIPRFFPAVRAMLVADLNASCISRVCPWRWANRHNDRLNGGNPRPLRRAPDKDEAEQLRIALPVAARHGLVNFAFPVAGPAATRSRTTPSPTGNPSSFQVR